MTSKKPAGEVLPMSTVLSYALGYGSVNQFISAIIGTYISLFLTDTFGVPAGRWASLWWPPPYGMRYTA